MVLGPSSLHGSGERWWAWARGCGGAAVFWRRCKARVSQHCELAAAGTAQAVTRLAGTQLWHPHPVLALWRCCRRVYVQCFVIMWKFEVLGQKRWKYVLPALLGFVSLLTLLSPFLEVFYCFVEEEPERQYSLNGWRLLQDRVKGNWMLIT